jgi:hypothetical protein
LHEKQVFGKRRQEKKKERYVTSGFHPETLDLIDELTHQSKVF